jgi:hypothetical protein
MKRITAIALFVVASFVTAGSALASPTVTEVNVPFNFTVNNVSLPAGTYSIVSDITNPAMLTIRDQSNNVKAIEVGLNTSVTPRNPGALVFHQYGDRFFLSEIHFGSSAMGIFLPATRLERHTRKLSHKEIVTPVGMS